MNMFRNLFSAVVVLSCVCLSSPTFAAPGAPKVFGEITDVIAAAGYTYVEIDTGKGKVWAAGPETSLKVGDRTGFVTEMPMANFHSKSMNRDFPMIYFVNSYLAEDGSAMAVEVKDLSGSAAPGSGMPAGMMGGMGSLHAPASVHAKTQPVTTTATKIAPVKGGHTIAEVYAQKAALKDKTIHVRGQVTKYTASVMGKNWLHLVDGSGQEDLTVVTTDTSAVGDTVVIEGKLSLDKDFDFGYFYPLLVEDARVTKE